MRRVVLAFLAVLAVAATFTALAAGNTGQGPTTITPQAGRVGIAELTMPDPDLGPIVGYAPPPLLGVLGSTRVLAVPADAPADLHGLALTGKSFRFVDPHGNDWLVLEYEAPWGTAYGTHIGPATHDDDAGLYDFVLIVDHAKLGEHVRVVQA